MKLEEIEARTHDYLWRAANEMHRISPAISKHLASSLVSSVPENGMSAFAARMHCKKCGGLLLEAKVRVRKTKRRGRMDGTKCKNTIKRTCSGCENVNTEAGVLRGIRPVLEDETVIAELRRDEEPFMPPQDEERGNDKLAKQNRNAKKQRDGLPGPRKIIQSRKQTKRKRSCKKPTETTGQSKHSGLAASFLFDPL